MNARGRGGDDEPFTASEDRLKYPLMWLALGPVASYTCHHLIVVSRAARWIRTALNSATLAAELSLILKLDWP
jgi:hypothetical protein